MKLYIAGPISNTPDFQERFRAGCEKVRSWGHIPVSPLEVCTTIDAEHGAGTVEAWLPAMKANICALLTCDGIYMLKGWENSKGASLEHHIAQQLDMQIFDEADVL